MLPGDELTSQEGLRLPSLSVRDALRATFQLYRRQFWTFALVMGLLVVPYVLLPSLIDLAIGALPPVPERPALRSEYIAYGLLVASVALLRLGAFLFVSIPLGVLLTGPTTLVASNLLFGRPASSRHSE